LNTGLVEEEKCQLLQEMANPPVKITQLGELNAIPYKVCLKYARPKQWYPHAAGDRCLNDLVPWLASDESKNIGMILLTFWPKDAIISHTILVDCDRRLILDPCPSVGPNARTLSVEMFKELEVANVEAARRVYCD